MSKCVMLIALAKIPAGKRCDFAISTAPHHHSFIDDSSTAKKQKLTKYFSPLPHQFSTQSSLCSILMVIELRPPVSESSTGSQNFIPH